MYITSFHFVFHIFRFLFYSFYCLVLLSGECFQSYLSFPVSSALSNALIRYDTFDFLLSIVILFFSVIRICFRSDHFNCQKEGREGLHNQEARYHNEVP